MKTFWATVSIAAVVIAGLWGPANARAAAGVIEDDRLAACINTKLGNRPAGTEITQAELGTLIELSCTSGVTSLDGLQFATSLKILNISHNPALSDVSQLASLASLETLRIHYVPVADWSFSAGLAELTEPSSTPTSAPSSTVARPAGKPTALPKTGGH